jgi:hypothetical protein
MQAVRTESKHTIIPNRRRDTVIFRALLLQGCTTGTLQGQLPTTPDPKQSSQTWVAGIGAVLLGRTFTGKNQGF